MDKSTKFCELRVYLKNGLRVTGCFHMPIRTSSAIRPSDALQEKKNELLLLTDVTLYENNTPRQIPAILMPYDSVAYIELPSGWTAREEDETTGISKLPPATNPLSVRPSIPSQAATPKWLAQKSPLK